MNLKHLETFHYFCKFRSMSQTAEFLHISQPAVSQQLRCFEESCGVKLFYREANQYKLTEMGESIWLLSKIIFSRVDQIHALLKDAKKPSSCTLRIGTSKDYARTVMPDLLASFQRIHPSVQVFLSEGNSFELMSRLRNRKEDMVVVARTSYDKSLRAIPFASEEMILVARPDHPLAGGPPVSITALSGESLIVRERGSGSRDAVDRRLQELGVTPSVMIESESLGFILAYIERNMGVSFILLREIQRELSGGTLKQIRLLEGNIRFYADILLLRSEPLSRPVRDFLRIVRAWRRETAWSGEGNKANA